MNNKEFQSKPLSKPPIKKHPTNRSPVKAKESTTKEEVPLDEEIRKKLNMETDDSEAVPILAPQYGLISFYK